MPLEELAAQFVAWSMQFVHAWGYLGLFAVSLIGNASLFFPVPSYAVVVAAGAFMNPWLVGIVTGLGAAIGELVGYGIGYGGSKAIERKHKKLLGKANSWAERHGMFSVILLFAATPLPDDVIGLLAGAIKYSAKRFFAATLTGKIIAHVALAWTGVFGSYLLGGWNFLLVIVISIILMAVLYGLVYKTFRETGKDGKKR